MIKNIIILFTVTFSISACTQTQDHHNISLEAPKSWHSKTNNIKTTHHKYNKPWWQQCKDQNLKQIITTAINNNLDYKIALSRIEYAKANMGIKRSILFPEFSLQQNHSTSKDNTTTIENKVRVLHINNVKLDSNWEIDLFGKNQNTSNAAQQSTMSEVYKTKYLLISIVAEIINTYIEYKTTNKILDLTKKLYNDEETKLKLIKDKHTQGITSDLILNQQESVVLNTKIYINDLSITLKQLEHKIETLCNKTPGSMHQLLKGSTVPSLNHNILINSPVKIISQRPDIIAAQYHLLSSTSVKKSSIAKQFPSINLKAAFGYQKTNLSPSKAVWSLAEGMILPLLNFGKIQSEIRMSHALEKEAFLHYKQNINRALEDIENALTLYNESLNSYSMSKKTLSVIQKNFSLIENKYKANIADYSELLEAQKKLYNTEIEHIKNFAALNQSIVKLEKSLGHQVI